MSDVDFKPTSFNGDKEVKMSDLSQLRSQVPNQLFIAGKWVDASTGETFPVENPATGEVLTKVASATETEAKLAMEAAAKAQEEWAATSSRTRAGLLHDLYSVVEDHRDDLAKLMTLEMGKPLSEANGEVTYGGEYIRWFAEEAAHFHGRYNSTPEANLHMLIQRKPVGPCFFITPWNFPFAMATRKIAPALAAGCTTILKAARLTPLTSLLFASLAEKVGIPAGVINVLTSKSASSVSTPILSDHRLRKLSFTGSTAVGKKLLAKASENVLRTSMELGGNAPVLVFADADLDVAVEGTFQAKMRNGGEACTAANRILVQKDIFDDFVQAYVARINQVQLGNGLEPGVDLGPMIDQDAIDKLNDLVADSLSQGGKLLSGGSQVDRPGYFFAPTVLINVPTTARIFQEEIFGPISVIYPFDTEQEAIELANSTPFGLASYIFTTDVNRLLRLPDHLEYGLVGANTGVMSNAAAPFGGVKQSGLGREGGVEGILEYTEFQYLALSK